MKWALGIDIGGTNVKAVAVTPEGRVVREATSKTNAGGGASADWVLAAQAAMRAFEDLPGGGPLSIGVCAPGLPAADRRSIAHLPVKLPGLVGIDWTIALKAKQPIPVANDAQAALWGETWTGAAQGAQNVVMLTLGTGVGGAVMCDGRVLGGARGRAGHIGHLCLDPDGPVSIVGMPGALEMMVGDGTVPARSGGKFATTTTLVDAVRAGDPTATEVWRRSIKALACGIASCINVFDPEMVVIGGGIALAGEALFAPLREELSPIEWRIPDHNVQLVPAALGEWAGAIGAARSSFS